MKCVGNDLGKVNISVSSISEDGSIIRKDAGEIPVKKKVVRFRLIISLVRSGM